MLKILRDYQDDTGNFAGRGFVSNDALDDCVAGTASRILAIGAARPFPISAKPIGRRFMPSFVAAVIPRLMRRIMCKVFSPITWRKGH